MPLFKLVHAVADSGGILREDGKPANPSDGGIGEYARVGWKLVAVLPGSTSNTCSFVFQQG